MLRFPYLNSLYSLTIPTPVTISPDGLLRVPYFPQSNHFLSTVLEGHYSMAGFYSISLQQTHKLHKTE